jgi:hypothetical protein
MDPLTAAAMPERLGGRSRDPIPNLRGEDESEITYLIHLIECTSPSPCPWLSSFHFTSFLRHADFDPTTALSWTLYGPTKQGTCILGRHPPPKSSASSLDPPPPIDPDSAFCASLYSIGKSGTRMLDIGPEVGASRKEVLVKLLEVLETGIGRMMLNDGYHARKAKEGSASGSGSGRERG